MFWLSGSCDLLLVCPPFSSCFPLNHNLVVESELLWVYWWNWFGLTLCNAISLTWIDYHFSSSNYWSDTQIDLCGAAGNMEVTIKFLSLYKCSVGTFMSTWHPKVCEIWLQVPCVGFHLFHISLFLLLCKLLLFIKINYLFVLHVTIYLMDRESFQNKVNPKDKKWLM